MEELIPGPITKGPLADLVFLEWVVSIDGYRFEQREANPEMHAPAGLYLTAIGTRSMVYRPLEDYPAMFREFADVELTPEGVVSFANKYGAPMGELAHGYVGLPMTATPSSWSYSPTGSVKPAGTPGSTSVTKPV